MEDDEEEEDLVPKPMVLIDQDADPEATIVQLSFGDRLGALIDTVSDSHLKSLLVIISTCYINNVK